MKYEVAGCINLAMPCHSLFCSLLFSYSLPSFPPLLRHRGAAWQLLRYTLDKSGLESVRIIASDNQWEPISLYVLLDRELGRAVDVIGYVPSPDDLARNSPDGLCQRALPGSCRDANLPF